MVTYEFIVGCSREHDRVLDCFDFLDPPPSSERRDDAYSLFDICFP